MLKLSKKRTDVFNNIINIIELAEKNGILPSYKDLKGFNKEVEEVEKLYKKVIKK